MKLLRVINIGILAVFFSLSAFSQAQLGISNQGIFGLLDTVQVGNSYPFSAYVVNKGNASYTGEIILSYSINDTVESILDTAFVSSLAVSDSILFNSQISIEEESYDVGFSNIIIVWPAGIVPTADSASRTIFVLPADEPDTVDCNASFNYSITNNVLSTFNTSVGIGELTYLWNLGDGTTDTNENVTHTYPNMDSSYQICLTITDDSSCTDDTCLAISSTKVGIKGVEEPIRRLKIYPNPSLGVLNISIEGIVRHVRIFDTLGRELALHDKSKEIDINSLISGVYFAEIELFDGSIFIKKFVKK